jgi:ankyrin repeat protein
MLLCLFSLSFPFYCSGSLFVHISSLNENTKSIPSLQDPAKISIYDRKIVPWLRDIGRLSKKEISSIKLASLSRLENPQLPPLFHDSKKLFELVELLVDNDFIDISSAVLKYMRVTIFHSNTFTVVLQSLLLENSTVFCQILKLWFPKSIDIISLIHSLVDLRLGEDAVMEIIYLTWPKLLAKKSEEFLKGSFAKILGSAMLKQYVSVFEDILERLPDLIHFINQGMNDKTTFIHFFCRFATDSETLNKLKIIKDDEEEEVEEEEDLGLGLGNFDHLIRGYPTANKDLMTIMIKFGADINARDCDDLTPLQLAILLKNTHAVQVLVDSGADVNISDIDGMTPLHRAVYLNYDEMAKILIESGRADFNVRDCQTMTPLHRAIRLKNANIVKMLLEAGADYNISFNGLSIYQLIRSWFSYEVEVVVDEYLSGFRFSRSRSVSSGK